MRMTDLKAGWAVVCNDDRRLGTIRDVSQNYVLVSTGLLSGDLYVPASAIGNVEHEVVHLNVAKRDVDSMGWAQPPREEDTLETTEERALHRHV